MCVMLCLCTHVDGNGMCAETCYMHVGLFSVDVMPYLQFYKQVYAWCDFMIMHLARVHDAYELRILYHAEEGASYDSRTPCQKKSVLAVCQSSVAQQRLVLVFA